MKRIWILLVAAGLLLFVSPVISAPQPLKAEIKQVTVYPGQAKITRISSVTLPTGEQSLLIENLPISADDGSFRASASGLSGITLLGLTHKVVHHLEAQQKRQADLERQIADLESGRKLELTDRQGVLDEQKKLLLAIGSGGGEQMGQEVKLGGMDVKNWEAAYSFFSRQLASVTDSMRNTKKELDKIEDKLNLLRSELQTIKSSNSSDTKTVQVDLRLDHAGDIEVALDYVVPNASWKPLYDARLNAANDEVELSCYAEVTQLTGEDWDNVDMTLSTSRPSEGTSPGDFAPWYLAVYQQPEQVVTANKEVLKLTESGSVRALAGGIHIRGGRAGDDLSINEPLGGQGAMLFAQTISDIGGLATVFVIGRKESIPSGSEAVRAPINQWTLKGTTKLVSRPRNHAGAYRFVTLTNQQSAPLMPGEVNIFAESNFIGKSALTELIAPDQSFELPFGIDNNVTVKREILSRKKNLSGDKENVEETIKITIANRGKIDRVLSLEEPLPTSNDNRVKIKLGDILPEPKATDLQGKASWEISLAPSKEQTVTISYKIEYPQGIVISGL